MSACLPVSCDGRPLWSVDMSRRFVLIMLWMSAVCSPHLQAQAEDAIARPNFIVIMVDDMGYGDAGCYGGTAFATPHLDRLAADGLRFTDFHSSGCVCSPTRAGLLTGRYQQRAGVDGVIYAAFGRNRHHGLQLHEVTLAEVLRDAGYSTAMFGKWHLGYEEQYNPVHQGFERYVGYVSGNVDFHSHIDGVGVFDWWHQNKLHREPGYTTHLITRHACDYIQQAAAGEKPFCLYVAHEAPHYPYQGPNDRPVRKEGQAGSLWNDREPQHAVRAYRDMMQEMDKGVGQILDTLQEAGLSDNTLVWFFSDNGATGPGSCGGLYGMKGTLWEGGHRVPGIVRWPGRIAAGSVTDQLASTIDVMPTLLDLANVQISGALLLDGMSLVPVLTGKQKPVDRRMFWESGKSVSMRDGSWKLIVNGGKRRGRKRAQPNIDWDRADDGRETLALFDLSSDRRERHNVAADHGDKVDAMKRAIRKWQTDVHSGATVQPAKSDRQ